MINGGGGQPPININLDSGVPKVAAAPPPPPKEIETKMNYTYPVPIPMPIMPQNPMGMNNGFMGAMAKKMAATAF